MYGSVMAIMAILAGVFTLVNVNVGAAGANMTAKSVLTLNLTTVGSFGALVALISGVVGGKGRPARLWVPVAIAAACFMTAIICAVSMP